MLFRSIPNPKQALNASPDNFEFLQTTKAPEKRYNREFFFKKDERLPRDREKRYIFVPPMTAQSIDTTNASFNAILAARAQEMVE